MWKIYLKQIRYQLRENKFFSLVYILGTALSITMVMMILITYYIKTGNVGVEDRRDRMAFVVKGSCIDTESWEKLRQEGQIDGVQYMNTANISPTVYRNCFLTLKTPEAVCAIHQLPLLVQNKSNNKNEAYDALYTDEDFWRMFSCRFIAGRAFNREEVDGKMTKVVITESTARRLYGKTDVIGNSISIHWEPYQVCGVIEDVPTYLTEAYGQVYLPYTTGREVDTESWDRKNKMIGPLQIYLLLKKESDREKMEQEVDHNLQMYNSGNPKRKLELSGQPDTALEKDLRDAYWLGAPDVAETVRLYVIIVLILLIVPALNISGLIVSRMKKRREEIGIRKAFGASSGTLVWQLMLENLAQMLIGGVVGLLMSIGLFQLLNEVLLGNVESDYIEFWHLVSPVTIAYVIGACLLLNLFSALVPAWRATRMNVVDALKK